MSINIESIKRLHTGRYNQMFTELISTEEFSQEDVDLGKVSFEDWKKSNERKRVALLQAIDILSQKEDTLLLTNPEINTSWQENTPSEDEKAIQDAYKKGLAKLTFDESLELENLMVKAMLGQNEIESVKEAQHEPVVLIGAVISQKEEELNIDKIKHEQPPPEPGDPAGNKIDPRMKLKLALLRIAAQKIKDAGGNLDPEEKRLLDEA